ncbi:membrane protein insertase YidC [Candidatus Saccharibacteria bacterium]|nr:YidC/Oxa1 family membrane protein insertase [Candidatus Saccharibacteria bacterium]NIV04274.1 membrane protein insertase YidC [Calditrichia bacterium]NIS38815.1 YidC/Oxa1 family membrane protein insertase [Candidatus Saccharibacteria bacterium]NIV72762.1 membrane protein insertase YidC [Calditrichia bacterium]NIV99934.1 membrane protein insertase YidC [Candidatus Saccharibacteria bacterium]
MEIFNTILYEPIFNLLVWFYNVIPGQDIGVAIIVLTVIIKLILFPFTAKGLKSQRALATLQPKIEEIKNKYKDKKEEQAKAMMELYSKEKVSPFSSCLPLLIQLPILFALYRVMRDGLRSEGFDNLYSWVANPGTIDPMFIGVLDLAVPSIFLAILAGAVQFWQAKMMTANQPPKNLRKKKGARDENLMATMNKQMVYFMPIMTVVIGATLPGGLALYWLVNNILTVGQQYVAFRKKKEQKVEQPEQPTPPAPTPAEPSQQ